MNKWVSEWVNEWVSEWTVDKRIKPAERTVYICRPLWCVYSSTHSLSTYARQPPCLAGDVERDRHQNEFIVGSAFPAAALWLRQKLSEIYLSAHSNN